MPLQPAALLCEPDPGEYDPQLRSALGRNPGLIDIRAHRDVLSRGHPTGGNGLLEMLNAIAFIANPIQHPVVDQKRYRQRTRMLQHCSGDSEIDRIPKIFRGAHPHSQGGPRSSPSPRVCRVRSEVLDEVRFGVLIGHIDDHRHSVRPEILKRLALHWRRERTGHVPACGVQDVGQQRRTYQPALHSRYYNAKPSPSSPV